MAQDQRVEWLLAAQVTGQNELARLTAAVEKLRQETEQLRQAQGGLNAGQNAVVRGAGNARAALDEQSKAMRNARQGAQQLGMQVNDFATSVSTGASPIQAFNQQIGQVGYALSMMGGRLGFLGRILSGPWSIVILGATMLLGQFTKSTDESAKASANFGDYALASFLLVSEKIEAGLIPAIEGIKPALKTLEPVIQGVAVFFSNLLEVGKQMANGLIRVFVMAVNTIAILAGNSFKMVGELAIGTINAGIMGINKLISDVEGRINQMAGYANQFMAFLGVSFRFGEARFGRLEMVTNKWAGSTQQAFNDVAAAARKTLGMDFLPSAGEVSDRANELFLGRQKPDKKKKGGSDADKDKDKKDQIEANKALQEYLKMLQTGVAPLSAYQEGVYGLQQAYGALTPELQRQYAAQQEAALLQQDMLQIARDEKALKDSLDGGLLPAIAALADKPTAAMDGIIARGEEMKSAFENVGQTVSEAFKGMLTGATSFKEGMKGIINSVISELWRLYVVQQIVGFFTGTVMPALGIKLPGKALGGSVGKNQPYMVGERGPELFIPGGSGTIIPNRNLGGGSGGGNAFNINVDARGSADPAAVRAQVQQGILEAAPAIIAAAEARTVNGLRRPRLGGVMQ